jgi:ABC-type branched-subunit amino acid transport system ATPase component
VMHEGRELAHGDPETVMQDEHVIEAYLGKRYAERAREEREG